MKIKRDYPQVVISKKAAKRQEKKHPWVYDNEILSYEPYENGEIVDVVSESGKYYGSGFINDNSVIRVRILSRNANDVFDEAFYERRLRHALEYRKTVMKDDFSCCRLIFGEADMFSGLTIDRFNDILVAQVNSLGMEKIKDLLFHKLIELMNEEKEEIKGIYERNDSNLREKEGLVQYKGYYPLRNMEIPSYTHTIICENGIEYEVDVENGQKTGFFLDQKYNRLAVARLAENMQVLDCFTHTGSFGLNAAKGKAKRVVSVDISSTAIEMAKKNAARNQLNVEYVVADVFDYLENIKKNEFDLIILDPPAFTKSKKTVNNAYEGYKKINLTAMRKLPRGGYLATCSCSHFMENYLFVRMVKEAAQEANVELRLIEERRQCCDHPILWNVPESEYLKFYIFQIC
ncbi:class I SAM-dependent rRNA methyltransferase [Traorella massiliensis]|uniref:class I SAM-dependent rRNA methyltransferase n=1 Tax=Traorella massiliensis TaxID=1903263 RepID=UPI00235764D7|nr:class I SAM-dependent rRNA methyltransferase [Traorella massiliensis]